jgi:hypothetical protein
MFESLQVIALRLIIVRAKVKRTFVAGKFFSTLNHRCLQDKQHRRRPARHQIAEYALYWGNLYPLNASPLGVQLLGRQFG